MIMHMAIKKNRVPVMMTDREISELDKKAAEMEMKRSEYIRWLIARHTPDVR